MHFKPRISQDIAFEWMGRSKRRDNVIVSGELVSVAEQRTAFQVTGKFAPSLLTGDFTAVHALFTLHFELVSPEWINVWFNRAEACRLDLGTGQLTRERRVIGEWRRHADNAIVVEGEEVARLTAGSGVEKGFPRALSPRIFWGPPAISDLAELVRLAAVVIEPVFFSAPQRRGLLREIGEDLVADPETLPLRLLWGVLSAFGGGSSSDHMND